MSTPVQICCSTVALRDFEPAAALELIRGAGYRNVEIWQGHLQKVLREEPEALAALLAQNALEAPVLSPFTSFTQGTDRWLETVHLLDDCAKLARKVGSHMIRTFTDVGPTGISSEEADSEQWESAVRGLRAVSSRHPDLTFAIETHEHTLADTLPATLELMERVDRPNVALIFQPTHDFMERGLESCWERLFPHVRHIHWHQMDDQGQGRPVDTPGKIVFPTFASWIRQSGYEGLLSIEYCWKGADPATLAPAREYAESLLNTGI